MKIWKKSAKIAIYMLLYILRNNLLHNSNNLIVSMILDLCKYLVKNTFERSFFMTEEFKQTEETMESMADFEQELNASFRKISEGDLVTGTVIGVKESEVIVDFKYYTAGIIPTTELSNDPDFSINSIQKDDAITATVIRLDDGEGNLLLSLKEATNILAWKKLENYLEEKTILSVKISDAVNAGVIAYVEGIRGFIPASQLTTSYVEHLEDWIGKTIDVQVITIEQEGNRLVLSGKEVAKAKEEEELQHKISHIVPGTVVEGTVETLMPYGAFVSLGNGLSGLVHISQICQRRIKKPSEVLKEGQTVKVKILNTDNGKISLSMKALEDEMIETEVEEVFDLPESEATTTSLGDLLKGLKL